MSIYGVFVYFAKTTEALKFYLTLFVSKFEIRAGVAQTV